MPDRFDDLPILGEIGLGLRAAFERAEAEEALAGSGAVRSPAATGPSRRWWKGIIGRPLPTILVALVIGGAGAGSAAATLTVLRGSPIPAPRSVDLQPAMTARASTQQVNPLRSAAPAGGPVFALRTGTSETGLRCVTVGEISEGRFGLTGTDGAFRDMPPALVDGCGTLSDRSAAVVGARVFDSPRYADVRTVVYGIAGRAVRSATAIVRGREQRLPLSGGAFVLTLPGYREDSEPRVRLSFSSGRTVTYRIGGEPKNIIDPTGPAWSIDFGTTGPAFEDATTVCVWMRRARSNATTPRTPAVCGASRPGAVGEPVDRWFFGIEHLTPGSHGSRAPSFRWDWRQAPARTIVMGYAKPNQLRSIAASAGRRRYVTTPRPSGAFAIVLPGDVAKSDVRVALTLADGTVRRYDAPVNLVHPQEKP